MKSWEFISQALSEPFRIHVVDFRTGRYIYEKRVALALAYADPREYQHRLDEVVGMSNWNVEYRPLGEPITTEYLDKEKNVRHKTSGAIIARLSITNPETGQTIVREEVGESDNIGNSFYPTASAQAFKRACAAFGLGRYLYNLPQRYYPTKYGENGELTFANIDQIRQEMLMSSDGINPETVRRAEERVLRMMYQAMSLPGFELPEIGVTEMSYYDLVEYGRKIKELLQQHPQ